MFARWALWAALCFASWWPSASASAAVEPAADAGFEQLVTEAMDAYRARDYDRAVARFEAAHRLRPEPELLYNIARSHERALRRRPAIEAYERFLATPGTTAELRSQALGALEALRREEAALERASAGAQRGADAERAAEAGAVAAAARPRAQSASVLPWVMIGGGAALAVAGGVFGVQALAAKSDFDQATDGALKLKLRDDARRDALVADVLVGAGLLAAGVGAILGLTGQDEALALSPQLGGGGARVVVSGAF